MVNIILRASVYLCSHYEHISISAVFRYRLTAVPLEQRGKYIHGQYAIYIYCRAIVHIALNCMYIYIFRLLTEHVCYIQSINSEAMCCAFCILAAPLNLVLIG